MRGKEESELLDARLQVQTLQQKYSDIEKVIQERKRSRAKLLEKSLSGTTVLNTELERLKIFSDDERKSDYVYNLTHSANSNDKRQKEKAFKLSDVLSTREAEFESRQESQADFIAKLQGQQVNARATLQEFRREHGGRRAEKSGRSAGEDEEEALPKPSHVLRKLEKSWIGDNFRLRCLRTEVDAARTIQKTDYPSLESNNISKELEEYGKSEVYLASSILDEILDLTLEEAQKRESLLELRKRSKPSDLENSVTLNNLVRSIGNDYLAEVVQSLSSEVLAEIKLSFEEVKHFASLLVTHALVNNANISKVREVKDGDSKGVTAQKIRHSLSSLLIGMSDQMESRNLFSGTSLFGDFLNGSYDSGSKPLQMKLNLEKVSNIPTAEEPKKLLDKEEEFWSKVKMEKSDINVDTKNGTSEFSCVQFSYNGNYLAAGTSKGEMFVWNLQANSELVLHSAPPKRRRKKHAGGGVLSLCWSYNSLQVCVLFEDASLTLYSLESISGEGEEGDEESKEDEQKIASLSKSQVCKSSKSLNPDASSRYSARMKVSFAFQPTSTMTAPYSSIAIPNVYGDVAIITVERDASHKSRRESSDAFNTNRLNNQMLDFLSRPLEACESGVKQVLCHGHSESVVFAGYSWDTSKLVTVDASGEISIWSCDPSKRTGFGWYVPDNTWKTNLSIKTLKVIESTLLAPDSATEGEGQEQDHEARIAGMKKWLTSYKYVGTRRNVAAVQQIIHISRGMAKGGCVAYRSDYALPGNVLQERTLLKVRLRRSNMTLFFFISDLCFN